MMVCFNNSKEFAFTDFSCQAAPLCALTWLLTWLDSAMAQLEAKNANQMIWCWCGFVSLCPAAWLKSGINSSWAFSCPLFPLSRCWTRSVSWNYHHTTTQSQEDGQSSLQPNQPSPGNRFERRCKDSILPLKKQQKSLQIKWSLGRSQVIRNLRNVSVA